MYFGVHDLLPLKREELRKENNNNAGDLTVQVASYANYSKAVLTTAH